MLLNTDIAGGDDLPSLLADRKHEYLSERFVRMSGSWVQVITLVPHLPNAFLPSKSLYLTSTKMVRKKGAVSVTNWSLQTSITQMALRPPGLNSKLSLQAPSYINHSDAPYSAGPRDLNCDTSHMASMSISSLYDSIAVLSPQASNYTIGSSPLVLAP